MSVDQPRPPKKLEKQKKIRKTYTLLAKWSTKNYFLSISLVVFMFYEICNSLRDSFGPKKPWESNFRAEINPENTKIQEINPDKLELQGSQGQTISRVIDGFLLIGFK